jgi:hypothetical protein
MIAILKRILLLLETYLAQQQAERLQLQMAADKERWLDCQTVKLMLRKSDRILFNSVQNGKLVSRSKN